jgi:uncharacterized protein (TIGR00369 family)
MTLENAKTWLELMKIVIRGDAPKPPIAQLIGFDLVSIEPDKAVVEFQSGPRHANPMGTLHGGVMCDIADAAMGMAYASNLEEGESFTTLELKISFFRPVWNAKLRAEAKVVKRGSSVGFVECDITDEENRLVARVGSTCLTLSGEKAKVR